MKALAPLLLFALLTSLLFGCAPLKPWERGRLQEAAMRDPADDLEAACDTHVHRTREAMSGAAAGGGVSCGCN